MSRPQHVVVVGAGLLGCVIARQLAKAGCAVTVLEKAVAGAESSSAAAGILGAQAENDTPGPNLDLGLRSRALWPAFARELEAESGVAVGYRAQGLLQLLLTARVLRSVGVGAALFIVPSAMLLGSSGVLLFGTLMAAAALKAGDQVLRYSIDKATVELLYLPVSEIGRAHV